MASPAEILAAGGLTNADLIVQAATATGIPLAILAAMVQKESGGQNIYGRDGKDTASPGVYANDYPLQVTKENFTEFRAAVLAGQKSNGVGPSQITYPGYWKQYPDYPFWDVLANLKFGATLLMDLLDGDTSDASISSAGAHYNGGTSPNEKAVAYGADLLTKTNAWRARLAVASEISEASVSYNFITQYDSPNHGGFGTQIALPAKRAVLHWWGNPSGQNPQGIIAWLCNPVSEVSAHAVVWKGNVACLVNYDEPSWANGNAAANTSAITLECDPNDIDGTIPTVVEYLADLVRQDVLAADFDLTGHKDWSNTACPGTYYPRLAEIRQAVARNLAGQTTPTQPDEEEVVSDSADKLWEALKPGIGGQQNAGYGWERLVAQLERIEARLDELLARPAVTVDEQTAAAIGAAIPAPTIDLSGIAGTTTFGPRRALDDTEGN